ncbi:hypothetical protein F4774DRAFT_430041 [Daldinia eschscholtzii]|nr:hypothetical protein F4774DRAFT_430041 [Daldinia eschscholtzii]
MPAFDYAPVFQEGPDIGEKDALLSIPRTRLSIRWRRVFFILSAAFMVSLCANVFFAYRQLFKPWELLDELPTQFAGLRRNIPTEILSSSNFDSLNRTVQDAAWSVYIMTSSHELHCVRVLRELVNNDHDGVPDAERRWHYPHLMHCLNILRESVVCNANDTPLYIKRLHKNVYEEHPRAGTGTIKMCRDWNKLLSWSRARSACYRPVDSADNEIDRYKTCPDGTRPWEQMEQMEE